MDLSYHVRMSGNDLIAVLSSSSRGVQRMLVTFGADLSFDGAEAYSPIHGVFARFEGLMVAPAGLMLSPGSSVGAMETDPITAPAFDWIVPWWNADTAGEGSIETFLQAETDAGWTRWYSMGRWSRIGASFSSGDEHARVETDTLLLVSKASRFKLKVALLAGEGGPAVGAGAGVGSGAIVVKRLGAISRDKDQIRPSSRQPFLQECEIEVPCRSQMIEAADIKGKICSPTCDAMALAFLGIEVPTAFIAADCWDAGAKIYGNWPFNVASLWRLGAKARLDYFPTMEMATRELLAGRLLIASIRFAEGKLTGAPISKTNGHLVLIKGLRKDETGAFSVLVNDPAAANPEEVPRAYSLPEFEKAWTGVAYVIEGRR